VTASWRALLLIPVVFSCLHWTATVIAMARFFRRRPERAPATTAPAVSLVKPVCGTERALHDNLSTACRQDYPSYEVVLSVQDAADPALPLLHRVRDEHPSRSVLVVVDGTSHGPNGRVSNGLNATRRASGDVLVYSDSDMRLEPDYLRTIVAPLADAQVGVAYTVYRAEGATTVFERLELLAINTDFVPSMVFASQAGLALACPGASQAMRRETLERIGGLAPMAHSLVEDLELGRRVVAAGLRVVLLPYVAATTVELASPAAWWRHQVYWNQNTRVASPVAFSFTWLIRGVPFALVYALCGGRWRLPILLTTLGVRLATALANAALLRDREGPRSLWLLPVHDLTAVATWLASLMQRTVQWRGRTFRLEGDRLVERS
jgi:ceramide glucosyltransferase